jgi:hypothetical protein
VRTTVDPRISEWGNPPSIARTSRPMASCLRPSYIGFGFLAVMRRYLDSEYIGVKKRTQGTETSKYLEERTSTETPRVVASESGLGQCIRCDQWNRSGKPGLSG